MNYKISRYHIHTNLNAEKGESSKKIIYSTRTGKSILVSANLFKRIMDCDLDNIPDSLLSQLFNLELIVPKDDDEFSQILQQNKESDKDQTTLGITIQPTANCQLGCNYCGQIHTKQNASEEVVNLIISRIHEKLLSNKKFKALYITWYGGEPLLAYSQIKAMSTQLMKICNELGIVYEASMITNGLSFKPHVFKELYLQYNVRTFQITIDGTREHHDFRRITKEGLKTFDIIFSNILKVSNLDFYKKYNDTPVAIRMNIDRTNYESVTSMIDMMADNNLSDKVMLSFSPVENWGDVKEGTNNGLTKNIFGQLEIEWTIYAYNKGFNMPNLLPKRIYQPCMAVRKDSEVYDALGNIYPCYEFPYTPKYTTSEYTIGNLKESSETYNHQVKTRDWFDQVDTGNIATCKQCNLFPICGGGCVKHWYIGERGCPMFKFNFEERLLLSYIHNKNLSSIDK